MLNKTIVTTQIIRQLDLDESVDSALQSWWHNIRDTGGMRLTDAGLQVFTSQGQFASYEFDINVSPLTPALLLALDRYMTCPYHVKKSRNHSVLTMFGEREAITASLYGNVKKFVDNLV
jgi:hypothetical protein